MGLKLKKFSTFAALCNNDDPVVNRFFNSFKLTAILLFDKNNRSFIKELNQNYTVWSRATGENLLFISFTNAQSLQGLNFYAHDKLGMKPKEIQHLLNVMEEDDGMDDMELYDLARRFGVNKWQLPVIVLTNNIKSNDAIVIKTSSKDVGDQLLRLTSLADREDYSGSLDYINPRDFGPQSQRSFFRKGIAEILSEVLTFLQLKKDPYDPEARHLNEKAVQRSIQRLYEMEDSDETLQERDDELLDYSSNRIAPISIPDSNDLYPFQIAEERMEGSEADTLVMLNTYNLFSTLLDANGEIQRRDPVHQYRRYDYSALSVCLGKMFENELSYSIVQLMRQCVGIPMPKYYGKFYNGPEQYNYPEQFVVARVKLNDSTKRKAWKAPSIGDAKVAYEQLKSDFSNPYVLNLDPSYEMLWDELKMGRNMASHRNPIDSRNFKNTYKKFCRFLDDGFFGQLIDIKRKLKMS